jgi:hypothetical protein
VSSDIAEAAAAGASGSPGASTLRRVNDGRADAATEDDLVDELDGVPVLPDDERGEPTWHPVGGGGLPVVAGGARDARPAPALTNAGLELATPRPLQTVAVAAGGFVAGVAVVSLVRRRRQRRALAARRARPRGATAGPVGELVQIVGSRSLLVDVHLLGGRD